MRNIDTKARTIAFNAKGGRVHAAPLHDDLLPLVAKAIREKRMTLVQLPKYPAKLWHTFFKKLGMGHLSFHSTRVTVVTRLARSGAPIYQRKHTSGMQVIPFMLFTSALPLLMSAIWARPCPILLPEPRVRLEPFQRPFDR
jgi:integrase